MKIHDIENMPAVELKSRRDELIEAVKEDPALAARYVQARTDAKMRDEKLLDQGRFITDLENQLAESHEANKKLKAELEKVRQKTSETIQKLQSDLAKAREKPATAKE